MFLELSVVILMKNYFIQIYRCNIVTFLFVGVNSATYF